MWLGRGGRQLGMRRPVLVVDDDEDVRWFLRIALSEWGYSVLCAGDGDEAMAIARKVTPLIIILDLWLPRVSGFAFRAWQLEQRRLRHVPVIVLTAAGPGAADPLSDVAALYKPVDLDLLKALLEVQIASDPPPSRTASARPGVH